MGGVRQWRAPSDLGVGSGKWEVFSYPVTSPRYYDNCQGERREAIRDGFGGLTPKNHPIPSIPPRHDKLLWCHGQGSQAIRDGFPVPQSLGLAATARHDRIKLPKIASTNGTGWWTGL